MTEIKLALSDQQSTLVDLFKQGDLQLQRSMENRVSGAEFAENIFEKIKS